jgi:hypothetical protein
VIDFTARDDVTALTEIAGPPRLAPVDVSCGHCTVEVVPPSARITLRSR